MPIQPVSGEIKAQPLNNNFSYLESLALQANGGPIDEVSSVSALNSKYPNGANGVVLVGGIIYLWNGSAWFTNGTVYQATALANESVTRPKIAKEAADYSRTDFLQHDSETNMFDGTYLFGGAVRGGDPFYFEKSTGGVYAVIAVQPNTDYSIGLDALADRFVIATHPTLLTLSDSRQNLSGSVQMNLDTLLIPSTEFTTGPNDRYLYVSVSTAGAQPFLKIVKGKRIILKKENYPIKPLKIDFQSELLEANDMFNLFDASSRVNFRVNGTADPNIMRLTNSTGSISKVAEVKPNTTYTLIRTEKSRLNIMTASHLLNFNEDSDGSIALNLSGSGETEEPKSIVLTTGANDKVIYVNNSLDGTEKYLGLFEGTHNFDDLPKSYERGLKFKPHIDATTINDVKKIVSETAIKQRKLFLEFNGNGLLKIYVPSKKSNRWIRYDYQFVDTPAINMKQWRVLKTYIVDESLNIVYDLDQQTEWEGAIKEQGASDFMGGTHGDERNIALNVLVDGKEYQMTTTPFSIYCDEIKIVNESILNRVGNSDEDLLRRVKISTWDINEYIVENRYTALEPFSIDQSKIVLMSCRYIYDGKTIIDKGRSDYDYQTVEISALGVGSLGDKQKDIRKFEFWGDDLYMSAEAFANFEKYPNTNQYVENFNTSEPNRAKMYFDITGQYQISLNEQLRSKAVFKIIV